MLLLPSVLKRVAANATDPLERRGQVDGHVRILDEGGDEHLEVGPGRLLVPFAFDNGIALGAQQTQRPHVAVKDVDGRETALEAVELEEGDSTGGLVALLVETRVVPEEQHLSVSQIQFALLVGSSSPKWREESRYARNSHTSRRSSLRGSGSPGPAQQYERTTMNTVSFVMGPE